MCMECMVSKNVNLHRRPLFTLKTVTLKPIGDITDATLTSLSQSLAARRHIDNVEVDSPCTP